jgi:hypothetical protein
VNETRNMPSLARQESAPKGRRPLLYDAFL